MPTIHVGCAGFTKQRVRYARKLKFVEIELRPPLPSPKATSRWRQDVGPDFVFGLVAPPTLWGERDFPLRDTEATRVELDRLANIARPLEPRLLVLRTPRALSPGSAAFRRLGSVVERARKIAPVVAWEPQGVWEREAAQRAVADMGLIVACDPLRDKIEGERVVYAHMRGLGSDRRYHEGRLQDLAHALAGVEEGFVVFDTPTAFVEATKLVRILAGASVEAAAKEEFEEDEQEFEEDEQEFEEDEQEDGESPRGRS